MKTSTSVHLLKCQNYLTVLIEKNEPWLAVFKTSDLGKFGKKIKLWVGGTEHFGCNEIAEFKAIKLIDEGSGDIVASIVPHKFHFSNMELQVWHSLGKRARNKFKTGDTIEYIDVSSTVVGM